MAGRLQTAALRIALAYLLVAGAWIVVSDRALESFVGPDRALELQTLRGWAFVFVSAGVLYWIVSREMRVARDASTAAGESASALARPAQRLEDLHAIDIAILEATDPEQLVGGALARLRALVPCQRASVLVFDYEAETARLLVVVQDEEYGPGTGAVLPMADVIPSDLLAAGKLVAIEDLESFDRWPLLDALLDRGIHSLLFAPMMSTPPPMGALILSFTEPEGFDEEHRVIAEEIAYQLVIALEQVRMREELIDRAEELRERLAELRLSHGARRELLSSLVTAQEDERERIAGDIHDDPVQRMTAVGLRLAAMARRAESEGLKEELDGLQRLVNSAVDRLRGLMFDLRPPALDRHGLAPALRDHLEHLRPEVETELDDRLRAPVAPEIATTAYRVAMEAIANARKHARASRIRVSLRRDGDGILVAVEDDGVGFDADALRHSRPGHMGLASMEHRAQLAGGWCRVSSMTGKGTRVEFWLPNGQTTQHQSAM